MVGWTWHRLISVRPRPVMEILGNDPAAAAAVSRLLSTFYHLLLKTQSLYGTGVQSYLMFIRLFVKCTNLYTQLSNWTKCDLYTQLPVFSVHTAARLPEQCSAWHVRPSYHRDNCTGKWQDQVFSSNSIDIPKSI